MGSNLVRREYDRKYWEKYKTKRRKVRKVWYRTNRESILTYSKTYGKAYYKTFNARLSCWKSAAKRKGLIFTVTLEFLKELPFVCGYTGRKLTFKPNQFNSVSLDRINNKKGYTPENVILCCWGVNRMKSNHSKELFLTVCKEVYNKLAC